MADQLNAGVVDEDVDRTERLFGLGNPGRRLRSIGEVLHGDVRLRLGPDLERELREEIAASRDHADCVARARELFGERPTDPGGGPGYRDVHGDLIGLKPPLAQTKSAARPGAPGRASRPIRRRTGRPDSSSAPWPRCAPCWRAESRGTTPLRDFAGARA